MNALELTAAARRLIDTPDPATRHVWPVAATHLTRQALEAALDRLWRLKKVPELAEGPMREQLVCLPFYLAKPELCARVAWTWTALSAAGHDRGLTAAPTAGDLHGWITVVDQLAREVG